MLGFILELRTFFGSCCRSLAAARNMKNLLVILQSGGAKKALALTASCHRRDDVALFAFYELPLATLEACHVATLM